VAGLALALQNTLVTELRWLPGRSAVTVVAGQAGLGVHSWQTRGKLPVVAGQALMLRDPGMAEDLTLTRILHQHRTNHAAREHPVAHRT
jgi:hypothetical protein